MCVALVFKENVKIVATIELKKCVTRAGILRVVIRKLCHW